jgi:hypothetical protein
VLGFTPTLGQSGVATRTVYHKSNGIITMKKHVELEHNTIIKKFLKKKTNVVVVPFSHELAKKWAHDTKCHF